MTRQGIGCGRYWEGVGVVQNGRFVEISRKPKCGHPAAHGVDGDVEGHGERFGCSQTVTPQVVDGVSTHEQVRGEVVADGFDLGWRQPFVHSGVRGTVVDDVLEFVRQREALS